MLGREVVAVVEFGRVGPKLPHDPEGEQEHLRDIREMAEWDHVASEAERAMRTRAGRRRWWAFWRRTKR
jgi:hypothetical protein